jgi:hypothetical protein
MVADNTETPTLAVYLVLSNAIEPNGCEIWVSPHGGIATIEGLYNPEGPYRVVPINGLSATQMEKLTRWQRDTIADRAEGLYGLFYVQVSDTYRIGLSGDSLPTFLPELPTSDDELLDAVRICIAAAHAAGSKQMDPLSV